MNLVGNLEGLQELKLLKEERKDFLRFLITEAKTSLSRSSVFKGVDGRQWKICYHVQKDELEVQIADESAPAEP